PADPRHTVLLDAERGGEQGARAVRPLNTRVQRVSLRAPVVLADGRARLHRRHRYAADDEVEPCDTRRTLQRAGHGIALARRPDERDVVRRLVPPDRRIRRARLGGPDDRGQRLVLHGHAVGGVGGVLAGVGNDEDHGIADVAYALASEQRAWRGERRRAVATL